MAIIDQYSDPGFQKLASVPGYSSIAANFKRAFTTPPRGEDAYAWKEAGAFPVHTPEDAVFSLFYAVKQARHVPPNTFETIKEAVSAYGFDPDSIIRELTTPVRVKEASADEYLIPEQRRLRVKTAGDVELAAYALERDAKSLDALTLAAASVKLVKVAADLKLTTGEVSPFVYKYAGLVESDPQTLVSWLEARAAASPTLQHRHMFDKIALTVQAAPSTNDRTELLKIAHLIDVADEKAGLKQWYGTRLPDALMTVFNTDKLAQSMVDLGNAQQVPLATLASVPGDIYADVLGDDFLAEVTDEAGEIEPDLLAAVLRTLPADMKINLLRAVEPYVKA